MMNATTLETIQKLLTAIAEPFKTELRAGYTTMANRVIEGWKAESQKIGKTDPWYVYPSNATRQNRNEYISMQRKRQAITPYVAESAASVEKNRYVPHPVREFEVRANVTEIIEAAAIKYAEVAVSGFIAKMKRKLGEIIESRNCGVQVNINGTSTQWNTIHMKFEDGTEFFVHNSIVVNVSPLGTVFNQFPTTFRNVKLANGELVKHASEAKLKKLFKAQ